MPSSSLVSGSVSITPPLQYDQFKDSMFHEKPDERRRLGTSLCFRVERKETEVPTGVHIAITADRVIPTRDGIGSEGAILANLRAMMKAFPEHEFTGDFTVYPEPGYEALPYRIIARGRTATKQNAVVEWTDTAEDE